MIIEIYNKKTNETIETIVFPNNWRIAKNEPSEVLSTNQKEPTATANEPSNTKPAPKNLILKCVKHNQTDEERQEIFNKMLQAEYPMDRIIQRQDEKNEKSRNKTAQEFINEEN